MLRKLVLLLFLAASDDTIQGHLQALRVAHQSGDWASMLTHAEGLVRLAPNSTRAQYNLACAQSRNDQAEKAVATLDRLARRGVYFDVGADEDLAALRTRADFAATQARFAELLTPLGHATEAFRLTEKDLLTEGITRDPVSGDFFVGSVHQGRILRVRPGRPAKDFASGLDAVLGLAVDAPRKTLWACTSAMAENVRFEKAREGQAALQAFDLGTGQAGRRIALTGAGPHNCNDLTVARDGTVYVSDSTVGKVLILKPRAAELSLLAETGSPQGLALSADEKDLFVADYGAGLARIDVASGKVVLLDGPADAALGGIDGLVRHGNVLVGIQNGIRPHRVIGLEVEGDRVAKVAVLERSHAAFEEPTLGVLDGHDLYFIANSQWESFGGGKVATDKLREPVVLKLALP
jgi:sugar lactone lactonase YvrE